MKYQWLLGYEAQFGCPVDTLRYYITAVKFNNARLLSNGRYWVELTTDAQQQTKNRQQRVVNSYSKISVLQQFIWFFQLLPWVKFVGVSGTVGALNAKQDDDIDLFLIVQPRRLWLTRLVDWVVFRLLGVRTYHQHHAGKNKLCLNYYRSLDYLTLMEHTGENALQLIHLIPVLDKDQVYLQMLRSNDWLKEYFPDWYRTVTRDLENCRQYYSIDCAKVKSALAIFISILFLPFSLVIDIGEWLAGLVQRIYMERHGRKVDHHWGYIKELRLWPER